jgi:hypothetical protein
LYSHSLERSEALYTAVLNPLGMRLLQHNQQDDGGWLVYGSEPKKPFFVVSAGRPSFWTSQQVCATSPVHIAFSAASADSVKQFHAAGMIHDAIDNGLPGDRGRDYFASYLIDYDGNNIEAGFRSP